MKTKFIFAITIICLLIVGSFTDVKADSIIKDCGEDHAVYNHNVITSCIPKADWETVTRSLIFSDSDVIYVPSGTKVMTAFGIVDTCPTWYFWGCQIKPDLFAYFI